MGAGNGRIAVPLKNLVIKLTRLSDNDLIKFKIKSEPSMENESFESFEEKLEIKEEFTW